MDKIIKGIKKLLDLGGTKKDIACLVISGAALIFSIFEPVSLPFDAAWAAIILCGLPIIMEAVTGLITAFDIKADVLVSLALIASVMIGEDFAAGEVAFIMQLGALLENTTVSKARAGIERLVRLKPQTARLIANGREQIIPAEQVKMGDILRVLPGEAVPVDGIITLGQTAVDQAVMTGEALPVDKAVGDEVSSGTVNRFGAFEMKATRVGEDSSIQRMIRLVRSADAGKAKIVSLADRWATWIVVIALSAAAVAWLFTGEAIRAVTVLVVFCPCALVLATPTAIMAAIGNAAKHGFLIREGDALERLSNVTVTAFDKTGTLTLGMPEVTAVEAFSPFTKEDVFFYAAAAEQLSEHPLGKATVRCYRQQKEKPLAKAERFNMLPGEGVSATVDGKSIKAGNLRLLRGVSVPDGAADKYLSEGSTVIYIAVDDTAAGFLVLSDTPRSESAAVIRDIGALGVASVLLTGDSQNAAEAVGSRIGLSEIRAGCLPEDKLRYIEECQNDGKAVCMIGDGINDAPALKKADVGIAMGGVGSDIAVEAADIALAEDDIKELPHLIALSKRMMTTIKFNLTFSMALNFVAITLAMTGRLGPVVGALVHNAGSVFVIINSALLLRYKRH